MTIKTHLFVLICLSVLLTNNYFSQVKVGDNPTQINANAIIEFESADKGVLLPRIALTSTNSASPMSAFVAGMVVYNTATAGDVVPGFYVSNGSNWSRIDNQSATTIYSGDGTLTSARTINMGSNGLYFQGAGEIYKYTGNSSVAPSINLGRTGGEAHFAVAASNGHGLSGTTAGDAVLSTSGNLVLGPAILNKSIKFITSNNERLTILSSGNVGIANTNPSERLDVTGNIRFSGALMPNNTAGTAGQVLTSAGAGAVPTWTTLPSSTNIYNSDGTLTSARTITMGSNGLYFQGAGEIYKYTGNSSVAPSINLGRTGGEAHFAVAASNGHGLSGTTAGDAVLSTSGNLVMGPAILNKSIKFITSNNERLTILSSGNVGIANTNPSERLDVTGNIRFSGALMPNNTAGTAGQVLTSAGAGAVPTWTTLPAATTYTGSTSTILNGTSFERAALTGDVTATQNSNTLTIANDAVTYAKMQNVSANNRILGRATTGAGDIEEITLGSGLTLTGTTLTANGDLRLVNTSSHITQDAGVGSNGSSAGATETILIGQGTGNSNSGGRNIFIGQEAGYSNTTPTEQIFIGYKAGRANTTGTKNTLIGSLSGTSFTTGSNNTAVGHQNLLNNTTGEYNTAVGSGALAYNTSSNNTAIGGSAMVFNTGLANTAIGALAMLNGNSSGSFNTALGSEAGYSLLGNSNTLIGFRAGSNLSSGSKNIIIGESIQAPSNTGNNQLSIGNLIFGTNVDGSGTTISTGNIGIGVAAPSQKLEVAGAIRFSGALMPNNTAGTAGQVLTSAGAGAVPTWTTLPTITTYTGSTSTILNGTSFERAALTGDVTAAQNSNSLTIANDAVTSAKIADGTITAADLNQMSATTGQILKWNGTAWAPATDNDNSAAITSLQGDIQQLNSDLNDLENQMNNTNNTFSTQINQIVSVNNTQTTQINGLNNTLTHFESQTNNNFNIVNLVNADQNNQINNINSTLSNFQTQTNNNFSQVNSDISDLSDAIDNPTVSNSITGNQLTTTVNGTTSTAVTLPSADGSETKVTAGTNVTISGTGTTASPYIVNAAGASDATTTTNGVVRLAGDLSGTAAAPTIANDAVTSAKIADGTITSADLNQMSATTGQILKWNGTSWTPATDNDNSAAITSLQGEIQLLNSDLNDLENQMNNTNNTFSTQINQIVSVNNTQTTLINNLNNTLTHFESQTNNNFNIVNLVNADQNNQINNINSTLSNFQTQTNNNFSQANSDISDLSDAIDNPTVSNSITGNQLTTTVNGTTSTAVTLPSADGSETKVTAGTNVTISGTGTTASPYIVNAAGASDATTTTNGVVRLAGDLSGTAAAPTIANDAVTSAKIADGTIATADVANSAVTYAKIQNVSANNMLLGRATTGAGDVEEITLGTGLSLTGTTLNVASATTLYNADGSLSGNRTVTQGVNNLSFTSSATSGTSHFTVDGTTLNVDAVNNRVGIGTATPSSTLHVNGTSTFAGGATISNFGLNNSWINFPTTGAGGIGSGGAGANAWIAYAGSNGDWFSNSTAGDIVYRNTTGKILWGNNSGAAAMSISSNNIGIGNVSPNSRLSVSGKAQFGDNTLTNNDSNDDIYVEKNGNYTQVHLYNTDLANPDINAYISQNRTGANSHGAGGSTTPGLNIWTSSAHPIRFSTSASERMIITTAGNIGLGTMSPSERLEVVGNIRFSGALMPNNTAGTAGQVLTSAGAGAVPTWTTLPTATTYTGSASTILNGTSFERAALTGDVTATQNSNTLTIANDAVTSSKIADGTIATADLANSAVTYAKIQNVSANNRILGRATTGAGTVEEITLGSGLTLTGTTLSASSGSLRLVNSTSHITQDAGVGSNGSSAGAGEVIAIGAGAGNANSAAGSVFIGHNAGQSNTNGSMNTYIGFQSGQSSTNGTENTYLGYQSGKNTTSGVFMNTFIGSRAGLTNTTGLANTALGAKALMSTNSTRNTAVGAEALMSLTTGSDNTSVGREAIPQNTTGSYNTALGTAAMYHSSNGSQNTAIGAGAGYQLTTGGFNTFLGTSSGSNITSGSQNIVIGASAQVPTNTASNQLSIGNLIYGTGLDGTGTTISTGNIGIGVTAPSQKLEVAGAIRFSGALMPNNSAGTAGQVLTSAGAGAVPTWTTLPTVTTYTGSTSTILNGTSFERAALTGDVTASQNSNELTIANNAVNSAKIADGAITAAKLNQMLATTGQVMKWNGTAWAAANDENTIADGSETKLTAGTGITISGAGTTASPYVVNANSSIATVTANYTATATNNTILCNVPNGGMTLTLPSASANEGKVIVIRKIDNDRDVLTFSPALNYSTTETISTLNFLKTITVQSNGTSWWIISE